MAYWWRNEPGERFWVEIRHVSGIGASLYCSDRNAKGQRDPHHELLTAVQADDVVYHWHALERRFVGRSVVVAAATHDAGEHQYAVMLRDFTPLAADVSLSELRRQADRMYEIRDQLRARHGETLHLAFQFRRNRATFGCMPNYFGKLPVAMARVLFGPDGMGHRLLPTLPASGPSAVGPDSGEIMSEKTDIARAFLQPFKAKADASYVVAIQGTRRVQTARHETLVNACAARLADLGYLPCRNAAVDLGLEDPPVVIEAKVISDSWAGSIREAVGQLYEYCYFKVANPSSGLLLLADRPIPGQWLEYLENDRGIGAIWATDESFHLSKLARRALKVRREVL